MNKADKAEVQKAKEIAKFSTDYDMSMVIKYVFQTFSILMGGLLALELIHVIGHLVFEGSMIERPVFLTSEIVHTAFGFSGGWGGSIVTNFFAKMMSEQRDKNKQTDNQTEANKQGG